MGFLDYAGLEQFWSKIKAILSLKVTGDGVSKIVSITQEEYDALSASEKKNGTVYITDEGIDSITDEQIDALFSSTEVET